MIKSTEVHSTSGGFNLEEPTIQYMYSSGLLQIANEQENCKLGYGTHSRCKRKKIIYYSSTRWRY